MQISIAAGIIVTLIALAMLVSMGRFQVSLLTGPILVWFGISGLNRPLYRVDGDELVMRNLLGMTTRRHPMSAVRIEGNTDDVRRLIVQMKNGKTRMLAKEKSLLMDDASVTRFMGKMSAEAFD